MRSRASESRPSACCKSSSRVDPFRRAEKSFQEPKLRQRKPQKRIAYGRLVLLAVESNVAERQHRRPHRLHTRGPAKHSPNARHKLPRGREFINNFVFIPEEKAARVLGRLG